MDKDNVLKEAGAIVYGDREKTYGHPTKNLACIASMWDAYLLNRFGFEGNLSSQDVAAMMTLLKIARLANTPGHHDSLVDAAGYVALYARCYETD